ncbi:MAG: nucleoside triphosphate pyrophosphohydrolase [Bacillota bacterium]
MTSSDYWQQLIEIMAALRAPDGCPWDREQDHETLKRYLIEEAYEVLDAIENGQDREICDELGDLLLQVVFHAQIAAEEGRFTIDDVVQGISNKMIRRHPHVFSDANAEDAAAVLSQWEAIKSQEKSPGQKRRLMQVNQNLPALLLAQKVQDKAARVGFDWPSAEGPWQKIAEELAELQAAQTPEQRREELGDVIFSLVNLARFLSLDSEDALRFTIRKFIKRFEYIEDKLAQKELAWSEASLPLLEEAWQEAKQHEANK